MIQRPSHFRINPYSPLASGLVFAGLGGFNCAHTSLYADSSIYGSNGTLTSMDPPNDWHPTLGRFALAFRGTDDYVALSAAGSGAYTIPDIVTVSMWHLTAGNYTTLQALISNARSTGASSSLAITIGYTDNKIEVWHSTSIVLASTASISTDAWRHIAVTRTGSAGAWTVTLYINGVVDNSTVTATNPGVSASQQKVLGRNGGESGGYLVGSLSDTLIHNRVLTTSEIQILADPSNVMLSGLVVPPVRRVWAAVSAAAVKVRNIVIGGGVI